MQSPFAPAEGVLTIRRSGLLRTERFTMNESSYTLRVPLEEAMTPNVVRASRSGWRGGARGRSKAIALPICRSVRRLLPAKSSWRFRRRARRLSVKATPRETVLEPGAETLVDVEVKDAQGRSVAGTDTAVVVVDESVLALTDYKLIDPLECLLCGTQRRM